MSAEVLVKRTWDRLLAEVDASCSTEDLYVRFQRELRASLLTMSLELNRKRQTSRF